MRTPMLFNVETIRKWDVDQQKIDSSGNKYWCAARPEPRKSIVGRFILAFGIFTGKYDAIIWGD